jgi:hypothetical protein
VRSALPDLVCVDPKRIDEIWPHAKHLIRSAIERTNLSSFEDIEKDVLDGKQLLWLAWNGTIEAAATTQLVGDNCRPVCILTACGGQNRERWLPLFEKIEKYAKDEGCSTMRIFGRIGWQRVLDGYHVEHVILEKEL